MDINLSGDVYQKVTVGSERMQDLTDPIFFEEVRAN